MRASTSPAPGRAWSAAARSTTKIVQHVREQTAAADKSFSAFLTAPKIGDENIARASALQAK